jgi:hypothetical protein
MEYEFNESQKFGKGRLSLKMINPQRWEITMFHGYKVTLVDVRLNLDQMIPPKFVVISNRNNSDWTKEIMIIQ